MFIWLSVIILIVFIFDFGKVARTKRLAEKLFFLFIAAAAIIYGYYYSTHIYTASIVAIILDIFGIPH